MNVVAVYSRTAERAKKFAENHGLKYWYTDMDEMLKRPDIDLVSVIIPNYLHAMAALKAIEHDKHVIVEKTFTTTVEDAAKVVDAVKEERLKSYVRREHALLTRRFAEPSR
ncbi:Gfo/Idh/MocA family oxidoreductase [Candidatus Bathyarchaeota archaeon]|nr:Gfo/Idh/MocA family oxidoreductase [Candidatus Bathyarchaeota archaeon]